MTNSPEILKTIFRKVQAIALSFTLVLIVDNSQTWATTMPSKPTGLKAAKQATDVILSWTASAGAAAYNVKRATVSGGPYTTIINAPANTATDTAVSNAATYYYVVSAVNGPLESANSGQITVIMAPSAPGGLIASAGNGQVVLAWSASSDATSYEVKRAVSGGTWAWIATGLTGTVYTDSTVSNGSTYNYLVVAVYAGVLSANSAVVRAEPDPPPPPSPGGLTASAGNGQVMLTWTGSLGATAYNVKRDVSGGTWAWIATGLTQTTYTDTTVTNGITYNYLVVALDIGASSPNSKVVQATPAAPITFAGPLGLYQSSGGTFFASGNSVCGYEYWPQVIAANGPVAQNAIPTFATPVPSGYNYTGICKPIGLYQSQGGTFYADSTSICGYSTWPQVLQANGSVPNPIPQFDIPVPPGDTYSGICAQNPVSIELKNSIQGYFGGLQYLFAYGITTSTVSTLAPSFTGGLLPSVPIESQIPILANLPSSTGAIVNLQSYFFSKDQNNNTILASNADIENSLAHIRTLLSPYMNKVLAFYIADEPYLTWQTTHDTLVGIITQVKLFFPNVPTYITFAQNCFDSTVPSYSGGCNSSVPGQLRGIPENLDWVGFDWYANPADSCYGTPVDASDSSFNCRITQSVHRLESIFKQPGQTPKPIFLTIEAFDLYTKDEATLIHTFNQYDALMRHDPQIDGATVFIWGKSIPTSPPFNGALAFPNLTSRIQWEGSFLQCRRNGQCPASMTAPTGFFKVATSLDLEGFSGYYSNGTQFCSFATNDLWLYSDGGIPLTDPRITELPEIPNMPYSGTC